MDDLQKQVFLKYIGIFSKEVHETAVDKGWWEERTDAEAIAAMHEEVSELYTALKKDGEKATSEKIPPFKKVEEELADIIIRALDYAEGKGYDIGKALLKKAEFNRSRPFKHNCVGIV